MVIYQKVMYVTMILQFMNYMDHFVLRYNADLCLHEQQSYHLLYVKELGPLTELPR